MEKEKIFLCMRDLGVVHAISRAIGLLNKKYELFIWVQDGPAFQKMSEVKPDDVCLIKVKKVTFEELKAAMVAETPMAVITGMSDVLKYEANLDLLADQAARALKIPVIGILEAVYLSEPFLRARINDLRPCPDKLVISSTLMGETLLSLQLCEADKLEILPMPKYADYQYCIQKFRRGQDDVEIRELNGLKDEFALIFISSSHEKDKVVLEYLADMAQQRPDIKILLTFHPKEKDEFKTLCQERLAGASLLKIRDGDILLSLRALTDAMSVVVCSYKSSLLFDASNVGCPTISLNPNAKGEFEEPLALQQISRVANNGSELIKAINSITGSSYLAYVGCANEASPQIFTRQLQKIIDGLS